MRTKLRNQAKALIQPSSDSHVEVYRQPNKKNVSVICLSVEKKEKRLLIFYLNDVSLQILDKNTST